MLRTYRIYSASRMQWSNTQRYKRTCPFTIGTITTVSLRGIKLLTPNSVGNVHFTRLRYYWDNSVTILPLQGTWMHIPSGSTLHHIWNSPNLSALAYHTLKLFNNSCFVATIHYSYIIGLRLLSTIKWFISYMSLIWSMGTIIIIIICTYILLEFIL